VYRIKNEIYDEIRVVLKERLAEVCIHISFSSPFFGEGAVWVGVARDFCVLLGVGLSR
jgi:hypothetical protein